MSTVYREAGTREAEPEPIYPSSPCPMCKSNRRTDYYGPERGHYCKVIKYTWLQKLWYWFVGYPKTTPCKAQGAHMHVDCSWCGWKWIARLQTEERIR